MVVRVRVRLRSSRGEVITTALANSAFEAEEPEVIIPKGVAERLGLYPRLPADSEVREYKAVGGVVVNTFLIRGPLRISVLSGDREVGPTNAAVVITPGEDEVVLSDVLMDALGIVLLKPGQGIWRFADDAEGTARKSEHPERW